jgi:hypothetical protein
MLAQKPFDGDHVSHDVSLSESNTIKARPWPRRLRSIAYWTLLLWFSLDVVVAITEYQEYLEDSTTFHQVYLNAELHMAISHAFGIVSAVALMFLLRGWKGRRFPWVTIACLMLQVGFCVANALFDFEPICCT